MLPFMVSEEPTADGDILNEIALANAYATCHNVQDLLHLRGFSSKTTYVRTKRGKKSGGRRPKKEKS